MTGSRSSRSPRNQPGMDRRDGLFSRLCPRTIANLGLTAHLVGDRDLFDEPAAMLPVDAGRPSEGLEGVIAAPSDGAARARLRDELVSPKCRPDLDTTDGLNASAEPRNPAPWRKRRAIARSCWPGLDGNGPRSHRATPSTPSSPSRPRLSPGSDPTARSDLVSSASARPSGSPPGWIGWGPSPDRRNGHARGLYRPAGRRDDLKLIRKILFLSIDKE